MSQLSTKTLSVFTFALALLACIPTDSHSNDWASQSIRPVARPGLLVQALNILEPRAFAIRAQGAGCQISPGKETRLLSNKIGQVILTEYTVIGSCELSSPHIPAIGGFGQFQNEGGAHRMGFVYAKGRRHALIDHIRQ